MIDTHIHLDFESYDNDREEVIARFFSQGGKAIVNIGTDEERINQSLQIAKGHEKVFSAIGFHPQEGIDLIKNTGSMEFVDSLEKYFPNKKIVAIGEIGLDYFHPSATDYDLVIDPKIKQQQKELFIRQLDVARQYQLPVVLHSWNAHEDCWQILKKYLDLKIVFHCYGKGIPVTFTKELLSHDNINFSFTGNITFPKTGKAGAEVWEHLKIIPIQRMMVETDGPFLTPVPLRDKRNEPANVKYVIEKIAEIKKMEEQTVEKQTDENAIEFFKLPV